MIWLSALLVFGTLAVVVSAVTSDTPAIWLGSTQILRGVPLLLLALLWGGVALGVASLLRGRRWPKLAVLLLEIPAVTWLTWYVFAAGPAPAQTLAIGVGDPFPAYALSDQDSALHEHAVGEPRAPALYIFYRGHW